MATVAVQLKSFTSFYSDDTFYILFVTQVVLAKPKAKAICGLHAEELSSRLQVSGLCTAVHC